MVANQEKDPHMTTALAKYEATQASLQKEFTHVGQAVAQCLSLEVVDQESYDIAAGACAYAKGQIKALEEKRKGVTGPLLDIKREPVTPSLFSPRPKHTIC